MPITAENIHYRPNSSPKRDWEGYEITPKIFLPEPARIFAMGGLALKKGGVQRTDGRLGDYNDIAFCAEPVNGLDLEAARTLETWGWTRGILRAEAKAYKPEALTELLAKTQHFDAAHHTSRKKDLRIFVANQTGLRAVFMAAKPVSQARSDAPEIIKKRYLPEATQTIVVKLGNTTPPQCVVAPHGIDSRLTIKPYDNDQTSGRPFDIHQLSAEELAALNAIANMFFEACRNKLSAMTGPSFSLDAAQQFWGD